MAVVFYKVLQRYACDIQALHDACLSFTTMIKNYRDKNWGMQNS